VAELAVEHVVHESGVSRADFVQPTGADTRLVTHWSAPMREPPKPERGVKLGGPIEVSVDFLAATRTSSPTL
jgi:hypothetical protein